MYAEWLAQELDAGSVQAASEGSDETLPVATYASVVNVYERAVQLAGLHMVEVRGRWAGRANAGSGRGARSAAGRGRGAKRGAGRWAGREEGGRAVGGVRNAAGGGRGAKRCRRWAGREAPQVVGGARSVAGSGRVKEAKEAKEVKEAT